MLEPPPGDYAAQFEAILGAVWAAEKDWTLMDRIDREVYLDAISHARQARRPRPLDP